MERQKLVDKILDAAEPQPVRPDGHPQAAAERIDENPLLVLVLAEEVEAGRVFAETVQDCGYTVQLLGFIDNVKEAILGERVRGVFLVMSEVSAKGIAAIIKASSSCGCPVPVIAAGPQWTRKTVLQAIKYGACDIVITPSQPDEIREKVNAHLGTPSP